MSTLTLCLGKTTKTKCYKLFLDSFGPSFSCLCHRNVLWREERRTNERGLSFSQHKPSLALVIEQLGRLGRVPVSVRQHLLKVESQ